MENDSALRFPGKGVLRKSVQELLKNIFAIRASQPKAGVNREKNLFYYDEAIIYL